MRDQPSQTAEGVCWMRAAEQRREAAQRIVDDPFAKLFLGPVLDAALTTWEASGALGGLADRFSPGLMAYVLCRHRYIDDCLIQALRRRIGQVVLLGAGYDTRAYRLAREIADRPVFEVDHPATSRRKAAIVAGHRGELPAANVRVVEVDFRKDSLSERLEAAGFQRRRPTFFVWEGVSMYLARDAVKSALAEMHTLGPCGSEVALDFWNPPQADDLVAAVQRMSARTLRWIGEPVLFGLHPEDAESFLERLGFDPIEVADAALLRERYVRDGRRVYDGAYVVHAAVRREAEEGKS